MNRDEPDAQVAYWHVELVLLSDDAPELLSLDGGPPSGTCFSFEPPGPGREAVLNEIGEHEQIKVIPVASSVNFIPAD